MSIVLDGLQAIIGGLGDNGRDKRAGARFVQSRVPDEQLVAAYESNWMARKLVDIPADDALRKWRTFNTDKSPLIEAEESRLGLKRKTLEAMVKGRLFGGAAIYIGTDQDPSEPLNVERIGKGGLKYLTVMAKRELAVTEIDNDPMSPRYGKPAAYQVAGAKEFVTIHPSRLAIFVGDELADPWLTGGADQGWGRSVLEAAHSAIINAEGTFANIASLIYEANVDVIGVPDLSRNLAGAESDAYESAVIKRFALAARNKGINQTLITDANETYNRRSATFTTLPQIMEAFALHVSAAGDIPATRFMAQSPSGLVATGESDMENYRDKLQAQQELEVGPALENVDACLIRSALGGDPGDIQYEWNPFKRSDETELSKIAKAYIESVEKLVDSGMMTADEGRAIVVHKLSEVKALPHLEMVLEETKSSLDPNADPKPNTQPKREEHDLTE